MIWNGNGIVKLEEGEPALRSCWECNQAHKRLKNVNWLHFCFLCERYWILGQFLDEFLDEPEFDAFFVEKGLKPGESTTKLGVTNETPDRSD